MMGVFYVTSGNCITGVCSTKPVKNNGMWRREKERKKLENLC